jgi:hypothetical protein
MSPDIIALLAVPGEGGKRIAVRQFGPVVITAEPALEKPLSVAVRFPLTFRAPPVMD